MKKNIIIAIYTFIFLLFLAYAKSKSCEEEYTEVPCFFTKSELCNRYAEHYIPCLTTCRTSDNFLLSSVTIRAAIGLAFLSSKNDTRYQINRFMFFQREGSVLDIDFDRLSGYVNKEDSKAPRMDTTIFHSEELQIEKSVFNRTFIVPKTKSINFGETKNAINQINSVIESETNDKLKNVVTDEVINSETSIFLETSFSLNAEWLKPFNESYTDYRDFYENRKTMKKVKTMGQTGTFRYIFIEEIGATVIELPFKDDDAVMLILLPKSKSKKALHKLQNKLIDRSLSEIRTLVQEAGKGQHMYLQLPVFELETQRAPVVDMLKQMDLEEPFSSKADFTPLLKNKEKNFIKTAGHAAFLNIQEKGVTAVGVTGLTFEKLSTELNLTTRYEADQPNLSEYAEEETEKQNSDVDFRKLKTIIINRPFIFAITKPMEFSDVTLFMGTITRYNFRPTTFARTNTTPACYCENCEETMYPEYT